MSFIIYDLTFLVLFTLFVAIFLYRKRHNLKREGLLYLYRTSLGLKFIEWTTKKYNSLLKKMEYPIVACGYLLMISGLYMILRVAYLYITSPYIAKALKVPIIMPLIPYLPELFKIDFLPHFYFTYWIIIIAIIAIPHEFAHGIFARLNKVRILSTGFGFLGPFLAAFVEQDDKQMQKTKKFSQLSILAAGTFANVVMCILFGIILLLLFTTTFVPAGVNFNTYSISVVNVSTISMIGTTMLDNSTLVPIIANNQTYFADKSMLDDAINQSAPSALVYDNSPALKAHLDGAISKIGGNNIKSYSDLVSVLGMYKPGDNVIIETIDSNNNVKDFNITFANREGKAFLGIGVIPQTSSGVFAFLRKILNKIKDPAVYYQSKLGDFGIFIFNLLWWIVIVNISVAMMNMLPLGIFDGGRFFYLTVWGITKKEKVARIAYKVSTYALLALVVLMLVKWVFIFF